MRLDNPATLDLAAIKREISQGEAVIVQYSGPVYTAASLAALNTLCEELDDKLGVRFYGHYAGKFDCANLRRLPAVKNLYLDCLDAVENFDALKDLQCLSQLSIGIWELDEPDFLSWSNLCTVSGLRVSGTRKNNVDLKYLENYTRLTALFLNGHIKNIEAIGRLRNITDLTLSIPSSVSIAFLNLLPDLKKLRFILGGRKNLDELSVTTIETLEIVRVKGFNGLGNLGKFKHLKELSIEDQIQLKSLDFGSELFNLTGVRLLNCKCLDTVVGLSSLRNLRELRVVKTGIDFDRLMRQQLPASLKIFAFYTTKRNIDSAIKARLTALGYDDGLTRG